MEASVDGVFSEEQALRRLGGNRRMYLQMAAYFLTYARELLEPLRAAKAAGEHAQLRSANHKLMGSVCNFGRCPAYTATRRLEESLDGHYDERLDQDYEAVERALAALLEALQRSVQEARGEE